MRATFKYSAISETGEVVHGAIAAASRAEALRLIHDKGFRPFEAREADHNESAKVKLLSHFSRALSQAEKVRMIRDLATLLKAEVGADQSLRVLRDCAPSARMKAFAAGMIDAVAGGKSLSGAFAAEAKGFRNDEIAMVRAGEQGGMLAPVLDQLASLLERRLEIRRKIASALLYPALLIVMSLAAIFFILTVLIPNILPLFEGSSIELPAAISMLLAAGNFIEGYWPALTAGAIVTLLMLRACWRASAIRAALDRMLLRMPLAGSFVRNVSLAALARTMATLLHSGVHLQQALAAASEVIGNSAARHEIEHAREEVIQGKRLSYALRHSIVFDAAARRLLAIGEESNRMSEILLHIAAESESSVVRGLERAMTLLTPCLTLVLGLSIGGLIMSVMQAIMSVNEIALQ